MSEHSRSETAQDLLARRVDEIRVSILHLDPYKIANNAGVEYLQAHPDKGSFQFRFWEQEISVTYPGFEAVDLASGKPFPTFIQALIVYYLQTSDGAALDNVWVSFSSLPEGRIYDQAFQGYTGEELARHFENNFDWLTDSARRAGGTAENLADLSFSFFPFPRVPLLVSCWLGDEDFPASFKILFDKSVPHYLPTDVCAILGSMLVRKLIKG